MHQAYHRLFENMSVPDMAKRFESYFELFGDYEPRTTKQEEQIQRWIQGHRWDDQENRRKIHEAWKTLFRGMTLGDMLIELNNVWIDPAYVLFKFSVNGPGGQSWKIEAQKTAITRQPARPRYTKSDSRPPVPQWQPHPTLAIGGA